MGALAYHQDIGQFGAVVRAHLPVNALNMGFDCVFREVQAGGQLRIVFPLDDAVDDIRLPLGEFEFVVRNCLLPILDRKSVV